MTTPARSKIKSAKIEAVKITAEGKRIPLGTIAYYHSNPLMRLLHALFKKGQ